MELETSKDWSEILSRLRYRSILDVSAEFAISPGTLCAALLRTGQRRSPRGPTMATSSDSHEVSMNPGSNRASWSDTLEKQALEANLNSCECLPQTKSNAIGQTGQEWLSVRL